MNQILHRLWVGDMEDAQRATAPVTQIFTLREEATIPDDPTVGHMHVPIPDETALDPAVWQGMVHALSMLLGRGDTILVHCRLGKSRSPALCAAYLTACGYDLAEAVAWVEQARPEVAIHPLTWQGVEAWWQWRQG